MFRVAPEGAGTHDVSGLLIESSQVLSRFMSPPRERASGDERLDPEGYQHDATDDEWTASKPTREETPTEHAH